MSTEAAKALAERLKDDKALRERLARAENHSARQQLVRAEGYDCTLEEVASHARHLSDAELERVVAGAAWAGYTGAGEGRVDTDPYIPT